jgi:hypothetical protein
MDKARKLTFIKDFGQALIAHLENEPNSEIQKRLNEGFEKLYQSALTTDKTPNLEKGKKENPDTSHNPKVIVGYLRKFTENTNIKYSSHLWDGIDGKGYKDYEHFIEKLMEDFKDYKFYDMRDYNKELYWNLIYPFLFQKKLNSNQFDNSSFRWGRHKLKVGWQYPPNILNSDSQTSKSKKPYEVEIPKNLRPSEPIGRKELIYFQDYIDIFKSEIEFRRNEFYFLIQRLTSGYSDNFKIEINGIRGLSFYTYCIKIEEVIKIILKNMDTNFPEIRIDGKIVGDKIVIEILQVNSYSDKPLHDKKINLDGGEFKDIQRKLISLCDFSIQSRFRDNKFYEFKYLDSEKPNNFSTTYEEIETDPKGFKYILTFYQNQDEKDINS